MKLKIEISPEAQEEVVIRCKEQDEKILRLQQVIENLINKCDKILVGGGMCFTFLKALNINVGSSIVDDDNLEFCTNILKKYKDNVEKVGLEYFSYPVDSGAKLQPLFLRELFSLKDEYIKRK
mgnify:CR=1 FL=1